MKTQELPIPIGISSCLLGEKVRYDGQHKQDRYITDTLGRFFQWLPVCPEVEYGLPVPREPMRLVGTPDACRLVTVKTGIDHTDGMTAWAEHKLKRLEREGLCGFIFKGKSPSSGIADVKIYGASGVPSHRGAGVFGGAFVRRFPLLPVIDDGRLHDPKLRENFIERIFVYRRWREFVESDGSVGGLVRFHTAHKLLVLAHSTVHYNRLGKLVAAPKAMPRARLLDEYIALLTDALRIVATAKKHTNVLTHMAGYFKKTLSPDEKQELVELIAAYHDGLVPLIVPVTLIGHYVRKFGEPYLAGQVYLTPHPLELMLRNHV